MFSRASEHVAECPRPREGIQLLGRSLSCYGLVVPVHRKQYVSIKMIGFRKVWIEFNGPSRFLLRLLPVPPVKKIRRRHGVVRFRDSVVELQCFLCQLLPLGQGLFRNEDPLDGPGGVVIRKPAVSGSVIRLELNSLLEGLADGFFAAREPVVSSPQISVMGFGRDLA